ncbi:hypothetical protein EV121DRAFT_283299 [Schizophyllum commune]
MLRRLDRSKPIKLSTAIEWLKRHGFGFDEDPRGLFHDGHEDPAQVQYRNDVYIPEVQKYARRMRRLEDGELVDPPDLEAGEKIAVLWFHDESTFYAHDRRKKRWVREGETPIPYAKGEGVSLMVADFVSMDYGWLRSPDAGKSAQVLFRAGKNRDGWFDNDDILKQAHCAMDILQEHFPDEDHILIYDNATTHRKRPTASLSALGMTKSPSANFFVPTTKVDAAGRPVYDPTGKRVKEKTTRMRDAEWNGQVQALYFDDKPSPGATEEEVTHAGHFKGMQRLLEERGLFRPGMKAQCNSKKYVRRTMRFLDAYSKGLDGKAADWAVKKFRGHRVVSERIMAMWDEEENRRQCSGRPT